MDNAFQEAKGIVEHKTSLTDEQQQRCIGKTKCVQRQWLTLCEVASDAPKEIDVSFGFVTNSIHHSQILSACNCNVDGSLPSHFLMQSRIPLNVQGLVNKRIYLNP